MGKRDNSRNKTVRLAADEMAALERKLVIARSPLSGSEVINRTILGDALEAIDMLPDRLADLLFADPPYNINKVFGGASFRKLASDDYEKWVRSWFCKMLPKLKPNASIYVCGDWRSSSALFRVLSDYVKVRNRITWEREKGRGARANWKNASEDIWFATLCDDYTFNADVVKLKKRVIAPYRQSNGKPKDWTEESGGNYRLTHPSNLWTDLTVPFWSMPENTDHPTQKPEKLLAKIILASSKAGDVVLDPFLGSGVTSVVAKKLGRRYVGIEIDKRYACLAEKRLEMADLDSRIQGYSDGVFLERNSGPHRDSAASEIEARRTLL